jgi:hypothetical protein
MRTPSLAAGRPDPIHSQIHSRQRRESYALPPQSQDRPIEHDEQHWMPLPWCTNRRMFSI